MCDFCYTLNHSSLKPKKIYSEKYLETKFREAIKKLGGVALKFHSPWDTGRTDRFACLPGGRIYLVEIKTTGKTLSDKQKVRKEEMEVLGFRVFVIDDLKSLNDALYEIRTT